ncbi:MAG: branched-chain amino acid ABC transporter permease [Chloroflexi bacterium]|nr:branched-chain amino acid ABC transporter permease [Chloroflexota bacterium]
MWAEQLVNGLTIGGTYALIALGYTMVYGVLQMINFAHGEIFMVGAFAGYVALIALTEVGLAQSNLALALVLTFAAGMAASALLGVLVELIAYRPLRRAPRLAPLISAIGTSIFLQNLVLLITQGRPQIYPPLFPQGHVTVGPVAISYIQVFMLALSLGLMLALYLFVQYARLGQAIRAVAEDKDAAALMGINVNVAISATFFLGAAAAGAAGVMIGLYYTQIDYFMGFVPGIKAFTAAVLGGIGNIPGAMLGGYFLGLAETLAVQFLPSFYKDVVAFSLLVLALIFKPNGLLGEVLGRKV